MTDKYLEAFVEKIRKACENYGLLIVPYGSESFCIDFIKDLAKGKTKHDSALAEFIVNLAHLWEKAHKEGK